MKTILIYTSLLLVLTHCAPKDESITPESLQKCDGTRQLASAYTFLIGRWSWLQTFTQLRGMTEPALQTPQSEGYTLVYMFEKNGRYEYYKDNDILEKGAWNLKQFAKGEWIYISFQPDGGSPRLSAPINVCTTQFSFLGGYNDAGGTTTFAKSIVK